MSYLKHWPQNEFDETGSLGEGNAGGVGASPGSSGKVSPPPLPCAVVCCVLCASVLCAVCCVLCAAVRCGVVCVVVLCSLFLVPWSWLFLKTNTFDALVLFVATSPALDFLPLSFMFPLFLNLLLLSVCLSVCLSVSLLSRPTHEQNLSKADKRAHHNALERKRRDHIKDSFSVLRDAIPTLSGEKASRAQILNKATDYIQHMLKKNAGHQVCLMLLFVACCCCCCSSRLFFFSGGDGRATETEFDFTDAR